MLRNYSRRAPFLQAKRRRPPTTLSTVELVNFKARAGRRDADSCALNIALNGSETIVSVSDTGRGIEPSLLPRVFDLFSRGTDDTAGFGVGLAVTRKLVELHGGRIEGRSPGLGRGSEFIIHLPIQSVGIER